MLTQKSQVWHWDDAAQDAYRELKRSLTVAPVAGELECWALVASSWKFQKYMQAAPGVRFMSDHNPLVWLKKQRDTRGKFTRWVQELELLNYQVDYIKGEDNVIADCLSRLDSGIDGEVNDETEYFERHIYQFNGDSFNGKLRKAQLDYPATKGAMEQLSETGAVPYGPFKKYFGMSISNGLLCMVRKVIVPPFLRKEDLGVVHNEGHFGIEKTTLLLRDKFHWRGMNEDVENFCNCCLTCLKNKTRTERK